MVMKIKHLLTLPIFLLFASPIKARLVHAKPPLKVNECFSTTVSGFATTWPEAKWDQHSIIYVETAGKGFARDINNKNVRSWTNLGLYLYRDFIKVKKIHQINKLAVANWIDIDQSKELYMIGDKVDLCLKFIPTECRKIRPDSRGEIYSIKNKRTKETYYGHYGKNMCGGA